VCHHNNMLWLCGNFQPPETWLLSPTHLNCLI
jgi:hypothetical protein